MPQTSRKRRRLLGLALVLFRQIREHPLYSLLVAAASVLVTGLALYEPWIQAVPVVSAPMTPDAGFASELPFPIKNNSWLFTLREVRVTCAIESHLTNSPGPGWGSTSSPAQKDIQPQGIVLFPGAPPLVGLQYLTKDGRIISTMIDNLTIRLKITYSLWLLPWHRYETMAGPFNWVPTSGGHRWIEGDLM